MMDTKNVDWSTQNYYNVEGEDFLSQILTGDETWVAYLNQNNKSQNGGI